MTPYPYQITLADKLFAILKAHGLAYLAAEERTGKTLVSLLTVEKCPAKVKRVLIVTKLNAISGWQEALTQYSGLTREYCLINYHSVHKVAGEFDCVILDESHAYIACFPKWGKLWKMVKEHTQNKPVIYLSATPYAGGAHLLFPQLKLSSYGPWEKYKTFYDWYRVFADRTAGGSYKTVRANGYFLTDYRAVRTAPILAQAKHLILTCTRQELGFVHEPEDVKNFVTLDNRTKTNYNRLMKYRVLELPDIPPKIVANTLMGRLYALHMLEGGVAKIEDMYYVLKNREKIDYILATWGDVASVAIMYHYIAEGTKLRDIFKQAVILQATTFAEGVDLSHINTLVIYSQDFSVSKHVQRRARQANKNRQTPIRVQYLLVEGAVSAQVYETVNEKKKNFNDRLYNHQEL